MKRLIIADDNEKVLKGIERFLISTGDIEVVATASNGLDALNLILELQPDVVLMDAFLPQLDALEILNRTSEIHNLRTLVLSPTDEIADSILKAGADYFMVKPFDLSVLASRIKETQVSKKEMFKSETSKRNAVSLSSNEIITSNLATVDVTFAVSHILNELTVPAHLKGYNFIRDAIILILDNPVYIDAITKEVYPRIAEMHKTTASRTERAIRHAITYVWEKNQDIIIAEISGSLAKPKKPSNSTFIASIANKLRLVREHTA